MKLSEDQMKQAKNVLIGVATVVPVLAILLTYVLAPPKDGSPLGWVEFGASILLALMAMYAAPMSLRDDTKDDKKAMLSAQGSRVFLMVIAALVIVHGAIAMSKSKTGVLETVPVPALLDDEAAFSGLSKTLHASDGIVVVISGVVLLATQAGLFMRDHKKK